MMPLNPFALLHFSSSEFNAIVVMFAMTCCWGLFVLPSASSWKEIAGFFVCWFLAQRAVATGGKYRRDEAVGVLKEKAPRSSPMKGTVVLMTGCDRSFGFQAAMELAGPLGAKVYLASLSESQGKMALGKIISRYPKADIHLLPSFNLADFDSIVRLVDAFKQKEPVLHVLINNAGVMVPKYQTVKQSSSRVGVAGKAYEMHTAVNFLGPLLLTELLAPQMVMGTKDAEDKFNNNQQQQQQQQKGGIGGGVPFTCRVINTASASHLAVPYRDTSTKLKSKKSSSGRGATGGGAGDASEKPTSLPLQRIQWLNNSGSNTTNSSTSGGGSNSSIPAASLLGHPPQEFFSRYGTTGVYGLSKLAVIYTTNEHSKKLRNYCGHRCVALSHHPGLVCSGLFDQILPRFLSNGGMGHQILKTLSLAIFKTDWEGAQNILHAATASPPPQGAKYQHFKGGSSLSANAYLIDCKDYGRGTGVSALSDMAQEALASEQVYKWGLEQVTPWIEGGVSNKSSSSVQEKKDQ